MTSSLSRTATPGILPFLLVILSPAAIAAGFLSGSKLLLPVLCAAPAYPSMVILIKRRWRAHAIGAMLLWAALLGTMMTALCVAMPERASTVVFNGPAYWDEMRVWLETGEGRESSPRLFVPQHLLHAAAFVLLSLATGSLVSLVFGAILMNYMAYYVAQVVLATPAHPMLAAILGWHPWSVLRIASFVVLGVILAEPLLSKLVGIRAGTRGRAAWILFAVGGLVLDLSLKAVLAPHWPTLLGSLR